MLAKRRGLTTGRREVFPTRQGIIATVPRCSFVVRRNTSGHRARGNGEVELTQCVCVCDCAGEQSQAVSVGGFVAWRCTVLWRPASVYSDGKQYRVRVLTAMTHRPCLSARLHR